jgi:tetratricopeptide (TPR) repeat protein
MSDRKLILARDHYAILGVSADSDFTALKKAYYRRVKECHPDLFGNAPAKEEEFKQLALSFDVLSDPDKRRRYDVARGLVAAPPGGAADDVEECVMDTAADDLLEELIVNNQPPPGATIATLLLDLQKTDVFMTFREGKTLLAMGNCPKALGLLRKAVNHSPGNILYRVYLARACQRSEAWWEAGRHYRMALRLGERRVPRQHLAAVRREWETLSHQRHPMWQKVVEVFVGPPRTPDFFNPEGEMIDETNRAIARLLRDSQQEAARRAEERKQLPK